MNYLVESTGDELGAEPLRVAAAVGVSPVHGSRAAVAQSGVHVVLRLGGSLSNSGHIGCGSHDGSRRSVGLILLLLGGDPLDGIVGLEVEVEVVAADGAVVLLRVGAVVRARADGDETTVGTDSAGVGGLVLGGVGDHAIASDLALRLERAGNKVFACVRSLLAGNGDLVTPATRSGTSEVLAGAVGSVHHLLVSGVLHGAPGTAVNHLEIKAVGALAARNYE